MSSSAGLRVPGYVFGIFVLLAALSIIGFLPSYLSTLTFSGKSFTTLVHVHAALMVLWLGMLILQPWLAATGRMTLHRLVGRGSFVVVPLLLASSLGAAHELLGRESEITVDVARVAVFNWGMVVALGGGWVLAVVHRRDVRLHMRYMLSTAFAIATAALTRVLINWVPGFEAADPALAATAVILLAALGALILLDGRSGVRPSPYWYVTIVMAITHLGYWTWGRTDAWLQLMRTFAGAA